MYLLNLYISIIAEEDTEIILHHFNPPLVRGGLSLTSLRLTSHAVKPVAQNGGDDYS